eukprot:274912_1
MLRALLQFVCLFLAISQCTNIEQYEGYAPIVQQLKNYVENNKTFAILLNNTFAEAGQGINSSNPIGYNDMYNFFNMVLNFAPNGSKPYDTAFTILGFSSTITGNNIITDIKSNEWIQQWINTWCEYLDSYNSTTVISTWTPWINMTEYIIPPNGFNSLNEFFYREINMTYRPISSPNNQSIVTVPCDGFLQYFYLNNLTINDTCKIKGYEFNLVEILGDQSKAELFENGSLILISLGFYNYHRYHSHTEGQIIAIDEIGGYYYYWPNGINVSSANHFHEVEKVWTNKNRRAIAYIKDNSNTFSAHIAVGVGEISSVQYTVDVENTVTKGDEIGHFAYGGSTVVLLFQNDAINKLLIPINSNVQVGQALAVLNV